MYKTAFNSCNVELKVEGDFEWVGLSLLCHCVVVVCCCVLLRVVVCCCCVVVVVCCCVYGVSGVSGVAR